MPRLFISYRRADAAFVAPLLADRLRGAHGQDAVFIDIDTIPLGTDFRDHIAAAVARCDVLLALLGPGWAGGPAEGGARRIDQPADTFRVEIEAALQRNIPVVPVLLQGMSMPLAQDFPPSLAALAYRHAATLRAGRDLDHDLSQILSGLAALLGAPPAAPPPSAPATPASPGLARASHAAAPAAPAEPASAPSSSRLRITRDHGLGGRALAMTVRVDGELRGRLRAGEVLVMDLAPGVHEVEVGHPGALTDLKSSITLAPGQTRCWTASLHWTSTLRLREA